jgi:transposase
MIRDLLKEAYDVLSYLHDAGYFSSDRAVEEPGASSHARGIRGKDVFVRPKGNKLRREEAVDIFKEDRYSVAELAEMYGVTESTIYSIKKGNTWARATGAVAKESLVAGGKGRRRALTDKDALDIYNEKTLSVAELAKIYDVSTSTVYNIKSGKNWQGVTGHMVLK